MTLDGPDPSDDVMFFSDGLLHKFGFSDGDLLYDLTEEHDLDVDHHDLLVAVVEQEIVPRLDQTVVISTWPRPTVHNPIRAVTVDGQEASMDSTITPDVVKVPVADILGIARSLPPAEEEDVDETPEAPSAVADPLQISFGADQLMAATRHVRRTHGGAELHLHHWLEAVLQDETLAGRVLGDVDRDALTAALDRRLEEGGLDFPFPAGEARDRATERARRANHGVVTTDDLAEAVVVAAAGLLHRLAPPSRKAGDAGSTSTTTSTGSGRSRTRTRSSHSSVGSPSGRSSSSSGVGLLVVGAIVALAIAVPVGWLLSRQRGMSAEEALKDRIGDLTEALATGDGDTTCEMLSDEAAEDLADRVRRELGETGRRRCPAAVQVAASERTPAEDETLTDLEAGDVDYDEEWTPGIRDQPDTFEEATATVVVAGGEVALLSENVRTDRAGSWTVTDAGPILDLLVPE